MYTKQEIIIRHYREGKSIRQISRELGICRKTVTKHITSYDSFVSGSSTREAGQVDWLSTPPSYDSSSRSKIRLTQEVQELIDQCLLANAQKRTQGHGKQCMKKIDILSYVKSRGHQIGYTTLCNYISGKTNSSPPEVFIRQQPLPGMETEFDWGEIKLNIAGRLCRVYIGVFTSCFSNDRYALLYWRQDTISFMECHVAYLTRLGGVYRQIVYDNMRVAVARFTSESGGKEPTRALIALKSHYGFSHRFCNAYRGNEKGHVERSVEYVRRKAFSGKDNFPDLESANAHLCTVVESLNQTRQQSTGSSASELLEQERAMLYPLPSSALSCFDYTQLRVDKYATVSYHTNRYSVPERLSGQFVEIKSGSSHLEIWDGNTLVAKHERSYGKHEWIIDIEHYLTTFRRKPGALSGSVALCQSQYLKELYESHFSDGPKDFIELLHYCHAHRVNSEKLATAVQRLLEVFPQRICCQGLIALLGNKQTEADSTHTDPLKDEIFRNSLLQLQQITNLLNINAPCNLN